MEIGSDTDKANYGDVVIPQIDPAAQAAVDAAIVTEQGAIAQVNADGVVVGQDTQSLNDWSAIAQQAMTLAQQAAPIVMGLLAKTSVPPSAHPSIVSALTSPQMLPQLFGLATAAPSARVGILENIAAGLLPAL